MQQEVQATVAPLVASAVSAAWPAVGVGSAPIRPRVYAVDRGGWALITVADYMPLFLATIRGGRGGTAVPPGSLTIAEASAFGGQVGGFVGRLARRALGQYELPLPRPALPEARLLWCGANIDDVARRYAVERSEVVRWLAWRDVVLHLILSLEPVRRRIVEWATSYPALFSAEDVAEQHRAGVFRVIEGKMVVDEARAVSWPLNERQRPVANELQAMHALMAAEAWFLAEHASPPIVSEEGPLREALDRRHADLDVKDVAVEQHFGLRYDERRYEAARRFVARVGGRAGMEGLQRIWSSEAAIPRASDLTDPDGWLRRRGV